MGDDVPLSALLFEELEEGLSVKVEPTERPVILPDGTSMEESASPIDSEVKVEPEYDFTNRQNMLSFVKFVMMFSILDMNLPYM